MGDIRKPTPMQSQHHLSNRRGEHTVGKVQWWGILPGLAEMGSWKEQKSKTGQGCGGRGGESGRARKRGGGWMGREKERGCGWSEIGLRTKMGGGGSPLESGRRKERKSRVQRSELGPAAPLSQERCPHPPHGVPPAAAPCPLLPPSVLGLSRALSPALCCSSRLRLLIVILQWSGLELPSNWPMLLQMQLHLLGALGQYPRIVPVPTWQCPCHRTASWTRRP